MNKFNKFFRYILYILIVALPIALFGYIYASKKVFINPIDYAKFNRVVPKSEEICDHQGTIKFYYYESVSEDEKRNNKVGLYIYPDNEKFIELADDLVNSSDGDWGYVLLPYNVQDTDKEKWNRVFYLLNKKHLIPIIQLWNVDPNDYKDQTEDAAEFLNKFTWPIRQRYVSVYNEPNSADFWYGRVDPKEYAEILDYSIDEFKSVNNSFFMLNGALNVSARNSSKHMDAFVFMNRMNEEVPGIFEKLDGWASHSFPQPNFSGSPLATGRDSIRAYETELSYLKDNFGVKDLPVFITETGWAHDVGKNYDPQYLPVSQVADYFETAYKDVWFPDNRVRAVTPFTIWYQPPADHFAWVDNRYIPYEHFQRIRSLNKIGGNPEKLSISSAGAVGCD